MSGKSDMAFRDVTQLRCPETQQPLELLGDDQRDALNEQIRSGQLATEDGRPIQRALDAGLLREDGRYIYPVRDGVPNLLVGDRIEFETT